MTDQDRVRWTKLVADYEASELTQREFATERGISFSNLRNWIYRLRKESRPLVAEPAKVSGQAPERGAAPAGSRLLPVRVIASAPKRGRRRPRRAARTGSSSWPSRPVSASGSPPAPTSSTCAPSRRRCRP
jgi:hypothetical protein